MTRRILLVGKGLFDPTTSKGIALFRNRLRRVLGSDYDVQATVFGHLTFVINGEEADVFDTAQNIYVDTFDLIIFRSVGTYSEEAVAVAAYCRRKSIPYVDQYIPRTSDTKLGSGFVHWEHGLATPQTLSGKTEAMLEQLPNLGFGWPLIVKSNTADGGRDNYLAANIDEVKAILRNHKGTHFIIQAFIPNDGDYRIVVLNGKAVFAIYWQAAQGSHLNNTSQGATYVEVEVDKLDPEIVNLALRGAFVGGLEIAGADILIDKTTNIPYLLEVNRAPQISASDVGDKVLDRYADMIKELVKVR